MARIIKWDTEPQTISASYSLWQTALVGVVLGMVYWGLTAFIGRFVDSTNISGDIATILIATIGIILAWGEVAAWSALLYGLAYILFSWIARYARIVPVLITIVVIVIVLRITIAL